MNAIVRACALVLCLAPALAAAPAAAQAPLMLVRDRIDLTQGPDAPVRMTVTTTLRGREAERLRAAVAELGADGLAAQYLDFYGQFFGSAEMARPLTIVDEDGVLTISEDVLLPAPYARNAGARAYAFDFAAYAVRPVAAPSPDGSLDVAHPFHTRHETIVLLPGADGDHALPPESLNLSNAGFSFAFQAGPRPDGLYLMALELRSNAETVPASEAAQVLRDQAQVTELIHWGLEIDLPAEGGAPGIR